MASVTFRISSGGSFVDVTLTQTAVGSIDVLITGGAKDITAVFFDLAPDVNVNNTNFNATGAEVTRDDFRANSVNSINGVNINPAGGFDAGVAIADTGTSFIGTTSFTITGPGLTLEAFSQQRFAVRLSGSSGQSKLVGAVPFIDITPPAVPTITSIIDDVAPITGTVVSGGVTNDTQLVLNGTAEANSQVAVFNGTTQLGTATTNSSGNWSWTTGSLANGTLYSFTAKATDAAGNQSSASAQYTVTVDTTAPGAPTITSVVDDVAPVTGTVANSGSTNDTQLLLNGTAEANSSVTIFNGTTALGTAIANGNGNWSFTTGTLTNGTSYAFNARATDLAGNQSSAGANYTVTIDTVAPGAPTITSIVDDVAPTTGTVANGGTSNDTELELNGTAEANSQVTVFNGAIALGTVTANGSGRWQFTTAPLADNATHNFTAQATDAAGNQSGASAAYSVTVNTAPPNLAVTLGYLNPSETPDLNAILSRRSFVDNLADSIEIEAEQALEHPEDFDGQLDGYRYYVQPKDGTTFTQTIRIDNQAGAGTSQNVEFVVEATNSSYIRLLQSGFTASIFSAINNSPVNASPAFTVSPDLDPTTNTQRYRITFNNVNLAANQYILLKATSEIDQQAFDGVNSNDITERTASFELKDGPGEDWGSGTANNNFFFSRQDQNGIDRFSFSDGIPGSEGNGLPGAYAFKEFTDSTLKVDFSPDTTTSLNDSDVTWQSAETLSGLGTYTGVDTLGGGGETRSKTQFYKTISGNLDSITRATSDSRSGSLLPSELVLTWLNPDEFDDEIDNYLQAQSDGDKATAYNILLNQLIDDGLFDKNYAADSIVFKQNGQVVEGSFTRTRLDGTTEFKQSALAGEIVGTDQPPEYGIFVFPADANPGETFNQFANRINQLGVTHGEQYRIDVAAPMPTNLTLQNFTGTNIALIVLPPGSAQLPLINGNGNDNLNLSNTIIAKATSGTAGSYVLGPQIGVTLTSADPNNNAADTVIGTTGNDALVGANGGDTLRGNRGDDVLSGLSGGDFLDGGLGDDILTGGAGADIFVLRVGEGTDTITDFNTTGGAKDKIGLGGGLQLNQLTRVGNEIRFGNEVLAIFSNGVNTNALNNNVFELVN